MGGGRRRESRLAALARRWTKTTQSIAPGQSRTFRVVEEVVRMTSSVKPDTPRPSTAATANVSHCATSSLTTAVGSMCGHSAAAA